MRQLCLALALVCLASVVGAMSTCKTLDLEAAKRKRIEAIRGQILSKLRMAKEPEPEEEDPEENIPDSIISLYNSTLETTLDQQSELDPVLMHQEEEEYFGKEMHKFEMRTCEYNEFKQCSVSLLLISTCNTGPCLYISSP